MAMASALLMLVLVAPAVRAVQHTVGGSSGWSQSSDFATWAAGETFNVGDTLLFSYSGLHSVDVVDKSDYDNCNAGNALESYSSGQTTISLAQAGSMYFMCPTLGHCQGGMKLAVNVVSASTTTPSGGTTSPPSSSSSTPPSTPTTTPSTTTTTTTTSASPPPPYRGAAAGAGFWVCVGALLVAFMA